MYLCVNTFKKRYYVPQKQYNLRPFTSVRVSDASEASGGESWFYSSA